MTTAERVSTPRRRRTIVCGSLRADGRAPEWQWVWDLLGHPTRTHNGHTAATRVTWECEAAGRRMAAEWVADVCATSWCRECPFRDGGASIVPLGRGRLLHGVGRVA